MKNKSAVSIDAILQSFDPNKSYEKSRTRGRKNRDTVTFWIQIDLKKKYDALQRRSDGEFGRTLKEALELAIQQVPFEEEAG